MMTATFLLLIAWVLSTIIIVAFSDVGEKLIEWLLAGFLLMVVSIMAFFYGG